MKPRISSTSNFETFHATKRSAAKGGRPLKHFRFFSAHLALIAAFSLIGVACSDNPVNGDLNDELQSSLITPSANFSWTTQGLTVTFTNLSTESDGYRWQFGNGQQSNETNPEYRYAVAGDYEVTLTARSSAGKLKSTRTVTVSGTIDPPDFIEPPGGIIPGTDIITPYPIDMGDAGEQTPGFYKGLPLRLTDNGEPAIDPVNGTIGVVCIGMSNAAQECGYYISSFLPTVDDQINSQVKFVNCAVGGNAIERWIDPSSDANLWDSCVNTKLAQAGITADQVRVIYHKAANMFTGPTPNSTYPFYPDPESDYNNFYDNLGAFAGRVKSFFPNVQAVYTTSRSFGGFSPQITRGEPLSYEEGHALNSWLADNPDVSGVWHGWGAYIWGPSCATGDANASGVCYVQEDYQSDGVHPGPGAQEKISNMIHARFMEHAWYGK